MPSRRTALMILGQSNCDRSIRFRALVVPLLAISFVLASADVGSAQDDPFFAPVGGAGLDGAGFDAPAFDGPGFDAPAMEGPGLDSKRNENEDEETGPPETPLSEQLNQRARRGDLSAADSISALARIGRWQDVDRLLTEAAGRSISDDVLAQMGNRIDPSVMIRIRMNDQLSDASHDLIDRMSVATKAAKESPERLRAAIKQLGAEQRDQQIEALRQLRSGGRAAIRELVHAVTQQETVAPRDDLLRALISFGPGGAEGLRQIALYGSPGARARAIDAVVRISGAAAIVDLVTALYAGDSTDEERTSAANHLLKLGVTLPQSPDAAREVALQTLREDLRRKRQAARQIVGIDSYGVLWSLNEDRDGVVDQDVPAILKPYRDALDASARLRRVGMQSPTTVLDALNSDLGYRLMVDAEWGDAEQVDSIRESYPIITTVDGLSAAIQNATQQRETAALIGLVRLASTFAGSPESIGLLHAPSAGASPLVRAVDHADPRVRFEAATAITSIAGAHHYAGSSRVRRTLGEMRSLDDLPTALLLETRPEVIVQQENLLSGLGYQVQVVGSGAALDRDLAAGGDIRIILSKTGIADMTAVEMVDRVRRSPRGRDLPILLYGRFSPGLDADRWPADQYPAPVVLIDRPVSASGLHQIHQTLGGHDVMPKLSSVDRLYYRKIATEALAELAAMR